MKLIKFLLLTPLALISFCTQAALINASNFAIGTEISELDNNTTITWLQNYYGTTVKTLPVSIQKPQSFHGSTNTFGGASFGMWGLLTDFTSDVGDIDSLDEIYASSYRFSAMLITYTTPTRQLTVNGLTPYGDQVRAASFGKNGEFLETRVLATGDQRCYSTAPNDCGWDFKNTFRFNSDAYYVLVGGQDASTYLESVDASVSEPPMLILFGLAGIGFALHKRRRNRKELLNT